MGNILKALRRKKNSKNLNNIRREIKINRGWKIVKQGRWEFSIKFGGFHVNSNKEWIKITFMNKYNYIQHKLQSKQPTIKSIFQMIVY